MSESNAELIAEADKLLAENQWTSGWGVESLAERLTTALEAAERERDEARKEIDRLSRELQVAEDQANTIAGDLAQAEKERDNWKMSAEEAERAEQRAEKRAEEAERLAEVRRETIREYERENESWSVRAHTAERERDRLDEAFDRDLPWRYDEVEAQRNQLAAIVEKVREAASNHWEYQTRREAKFGREGSSCVCEVCDIMRALATAPDDALREHDAALIEGLADEVWGSHLQLEAWGWLREKARQRREEKP